MPSILMPALSPTMEEGKVSKWLKKVGDTIKSGDVLAEIETDKATMEVEAVDEGTLTAILVPEGTDNVKVNTAIAVIGEADATAPSSGAVAPPSPSRGEGDNGRRLHLRANIFLTSSTHMVSETVICARRWLAYSSRDSTPLASCAPSAKSFNVTSPLAFSSPP